MRSRAGLFLCREAMRAPARYGFLGVTGARLRHSGWYVRPNAPNVRICTSWDPRSAQMRTFVPNVQSIWARLCHSGESVRACRGKRHRKNPVASGSRTKKGDMAETEWPRRALYFSSSLWKRRSTNSSRRSSVISSRLACSTAKAGSSGETSSSSPLLGL